MFSLSLMLFFTSQHTVVQPMPHEKYVHFYITYRDFYRLCKAFLGQKVTDYLAEEKFGLSTYKSVGEEIISNKALSIYPSVLSCAMQKG